MLRRDAERGEENWNTRSTDREKKVETEYRKELVEEKKTSLEEAKNQQT